MTYQPVLVSSGYAGWTFLQKTLQKQMAAFAASPQIERDTAYFTANINKVTSVDQLLSDRRLLKVALGAFGLDDQINSKALIRQVLTQGPSDSNALANKLTDKRYLALAQAFDFSNSDKVPTQQPAFSSKIVAAFEGSQFQAAVGQQDSDLQLALNAQGALSGLAATNSSEPTKWYNVMGSPSMRKIFETALGLPSGFVSINIDQQLSVFQQKSAEVFGDGSVSQFTDPAKMNQLIKLFLVRSSASTAQSTPASSIALQLLQGT
ncbi:MAG: DUF1217 domain-containing protein, partial [Paracoccaceae bacterium]|nr:DUF1217 domain-containing protein [Paracoccaceae bacterium]